MACSYSTKVKGKVSKLVVDIQGQMIFLFSPSYQPNLYVCYTEMLQQQQELCRDWMELPQPCSNGKSGQKENEITEFGYPESTTELSFLILMIVHFSSALKSFSCHFSLSFWLFQQGQGKTQWKRLCVMWFFFFFFLIWIQFNWTDALQDSDWSAPWGQRGAHLQHPQPQKHGGLRLMAKGPSDRRLLCILPVLHTAVCVG